MSVRRISSTPTLKSTRTKALPPASTKGGDDKTSITRAKTVVDTSGPLFCRYSSELQRDPRMPLHGSFAPGGANACPACETTLEVEQGRAWKIVKEILHERISTPEYDDEIIEERIFLLGNRFVIKCHREDGGFACLLCYRNRDKDTLLESAQGLVRHIWQKHEVEEFGDIDIKEVG